MAIAVKAGGGCGPHFLELDRTAKGPLSSPGVIGRGCEAAVLLELHGERRHFPICPFAGLEFGSRTIRPSISCFLATGNDDTEPLITPKGVDITLLRSRHAGNEERSLLLI
jgi:hypothetical protein